MSDLTPITIKPDNGVQYFAYQCSECGGKARNTYCEPYRTTLLERRLCYTCGHWQDFERKLEQDHTRRTLIGGYVYAPGNRTSGSFRGMAGRRFDIEYIEPSQFAGKIITTFDLWGGGLLPEKLRAKFPDTARFLGDAKRAQVGSTTCWNPSDGRVPAYPLPSSLRGLV